MTDLPPGQFATIVADPPWRYTQTPPPRTGCGVSAEHQYPTLTTEELAAMPVIYSTAPRAHLYLWVTNPVLLGLRPTILGTTSAADIARAWGFEPKTILTWVKTTNDGVPMRGGLGWYFRGATEHVLFAVRGDLGIPAALREPNVLLAPRSRHSAKPESFLDMVERVSPGPRLELFARRERPGWTAWGDEAPPPLSCKEAA